MNKLSLVSPATAACLIVLCFAVNVLSLQAEELDFSCLEEKVLNKAQVSQSYQEFDIILENHCPGTVQWSMCIERMNPFTNEIMETLTPSGQILVDKKFRVNLQMKKQANESEEAFQEFYVNFAFNVNERAMVQCVATRCESKKQSLRAKQRANNRAKQAAMKTLSKQLEKDCPQTGWDTGKESECEARVRAENKPKMQQFAINDAAIREELAAVDPEQCTVYSGD